MSSRIARIETFVAAHPVVGSFKYTTAATQDTVLEKITDDTREDRLGKERAVADVELRDHRDGAIDDRSLPWSGPHR